MLTNDYSFNVDRYVNEKRERAPSSFKHEVLVKYFSKYLFDMIMSKFEWDIPKDWDRNYFFNNLYKNGSIALTDIAPFGVIPQKYNFIVEDNLNVYGKPTMIHIINPYINKTVKRRIDKDCVILKFRYDYKSFYDIVEYYAELLASASESVSINLINSKFSFAVGVSNEAQAETVKAWYDNVQKGMPLTVLDNESLDGMTPVTILSQNLAQNYITPQLLEDIRTITNMFCTDIGICNNNYEKKERMISDEVNANNEETESKISLWYNHLKECVEKANSLLGINISVELKESEKEEEANAEIDNK